MITVLAGMMNTLSQIGNAYPNLSFFASFAFYSWLGNAIVTHYLIEKQIRHWPSRVVFVVTFACSISLLSMYMFEIMRFPIEQRYWKIVLWVLVMMCEVILPLCLISRLPMAGKGCKLFGYQVSVVGLICCIIYLGLLFKILNDQAQGVQGGMFQLKLLIDVVVHYGVYLMALMSAYGAIWSPYVYYNMLNQKQIHRIASAKLKTQEQIHFIIEQTKTHKLQLLKINNEIGKLKKQIEVSSSRESNLFKLMVKGLMGTGRAKEEQLQKLYQDKTRKQQQLQTLHKVHQQSFLHYRDILEQERRHMLSETPLGKIFRKMSFVLAAYSVTRIVLTIINTIRGRKMSTDPITRLLNLIEWVYGKQFNMLINQISQYISFFFMGYLMVTSIRSFSMNLKAFLDYILRRRRLNILDSATQIYFFSLVYGVYFLAAVILQQCGLPRNFVTSFEMLTGISQNTDLLRHFVLFDWLFMGMCLFSICLVLFTEYQRGGTLDNIIRQRNLVDFVSKQDK